jgi:hypothetical protein
MPSQSQLDWDNTVSRNQQKETRERRSTQRSMKDEMNKALRGASSTKERREIKEQFKIDTNKASSQTDNQTGVNQDSNQRGDDSFKPSYYEIPDGGGNVEFNGSVLICINGDPYYIDIPYDSETGPYSPSSGANFPITAP